MRVVVDASVALKWFFRLRDDEENVDAALRVLQGVHAGELSLLQPPHFLAEVAAVLAREAADSAAANLRDLCDIEMQVLESTAAYERAMGLSARYQHHLFDTLYHAVALESDAVLVTADAHYARKARALGGLNTLSEFARRI